MGFLEAMGNILAGKPAYGPSSNNPHGARTERGKYIPSVRVAQTHCRVDGSKLDIYGTIRNDSSELIFLDKIFLLGTKRELDSQLRPGESKQYLLYSGKKLERQPSGRAEIWYKKQSDDDLFSNFHSVRSRRDGSNGFVISDLLPDGMVKDI